MLNLSMRSWGRSAAVMAILAAVATPGLAEPIPVDDLARLPMIANPSLSQDGRYLVALVAADGAASEKPAISVWDLDNPEKAPAVAQADRDSEFIAVSALKAGGILAFARKPFTGDTLGCDGERSIGVTRTYTRKPLLTDVRLRKFEDPFDASGIQWGVGERTKRCLEIAVLGSVLGNLLTLDPENVVIAEVNQRSFRTSYKKLNLKTGKTKLLFLDSDDESAGLLDPRDATIWTKSKTDYEDGGAKFEKLIRDAHSGGYSVHDELTTETEERESVGIAGRDEATGKFYVVTDQFSDHSEIYFYDPNTREYDPEPLFRHDEFDAAGVVLGRTPSDFNKLLGYVYLGDIVRVEWIDPYFGQIQSVLEAAFEGHDIGIVDYSADKNKVLFSASASNFPTRYFILEGGNKLIPVGEARPWIDPKDTSPTKLIYYSARDGLEIPAFLTMPAGWKRGDPRPPSVVMPHGGPWSRDTAGWDPTGWVPFFTSRGFSVLQPQYRGSTGWGRALWKAGDAEWGLKMQDDKDDGARWMASEGFADQNRTIIFGYSYGGFAAFAASVRPGGPFRCAIAGAGVSDLENIGNNWSDNRLQRIYQGKTVDGMDPMKNTDKISMPILIIHGDRDIRVPIFHSEKFYARIEGQTKATYVKVEDMPHSLPWTPAQQRKTLNAIDNFLATDCKL